ncbi:uncharacterized protein ColSpa_09942 [Colletotrichum spaethianum]|uniref:Apple domain-containing protein n=1 Tax=Colletotrichum spaethianum TaxID=700344 RepID=A0AA37PCI4_9PEZI|nr:uncharacterized protein ColSpa_09942 [Colletotrichum spaethianum]GKT49761.1 hypothetical protein ColSpa_09942 [Colletotrichum spaethianum]
MSCFGRKRRRDVLRREACIYRLESKPRRQLCWLQRLYVSFGAVLTTFSSSRNGYCGTTSDFCGFGCQSSFSPGTCTACPGSACAGTVSSNPTCSANNGFCWTLNSKKFQIVCDRLATGDNLSYVDATSLGDCISKCGSTAGCVAASFYQGASTTCTLLSAYRGSADANSAGGSKNHAYVRSPSCG